MQPDMCSLLISTLRGVVGKTLLGFARESRRAMSSRSSDRIHPELDLIHKKLEELEKKMKLAGYKPELEFALHDLEEEQKKNLLLWHSEKLAVAFGCLKLPQGSPIQVFKNLRICGDCHKAIKYISEIERREILVRDTTRFHHFSSFDSSLLVKPDVTTVFICVIVVKKVS
ncbi:unnamed protein product [Microthlaspi erraticum]|uniref:DYW domain-containing protein n=1 Tax=Microthlaspi erraticum TaxID=1685480 RepID=A0A6D2HHM1_9BRAS|nr:unnamed protein product [Microthlaspi erraticum]